MASIPVLYLDPNPETFKKVEHHLRLNKGLVFEFAKVPTMESGLNAFEDPHFQICLLDYAFAVKKDFAYLSQLRKRDRHKHIIFLVDSLDNLDFDLAFSPTSDYLLKSEISSYTLGHLIRSSLEKQANIKRARATSFRDELTGLMKPAMFQEFYQYISAANDRHGFSVHLCLCDLDNVKKINRDYGVWAGNEAIAHFGKIIKSNLRSNDLVSRLDGDRFLLLFTHATSGQVSECVHRILNTLAMNPLAMDDNQIPVSGCFGIVALKGKKELEPFTLEAHDALKKAKRKGPGKVVFGN